MRNLVGIRKKIEDLQSIIDQNSQDVCFIEVWGKSDIGKTTLGNEVVTQSHCKDEGFCYLKNAREESPKNDGVIDLRKELLSTLLKEKVSDIDTSNKLPHFAEIKLENEDNDDDDDEEENGRRRTMRTNLETEKEYVGFDRRAMVRRRRWEAQKVEALEFVFYS